MLRQAIILAGGFGTRLRGAAGDVPKTLASIGGRPFLEYLLDHLITSGVEEAILATGYMHEAVQQHFGSRYRNLGIIYSVEKEPLGTGGAIAKALESVSEKSCLVVNGDTFFAVDFADFAGSPAIKSFKTIIALKSMTMFDRYGRVETEGDRIVAFHEKGFCKTGLINGGVYIIDKEWFADVAPGKIFSFERDILEKYVAYGAVGCYISDGYFIDIGIPEDFERANRELPFISGPV